MRPRTSWRTLVAILVTLSSAPAAFAAQTPYFGAPAAVPAKIQAETYDRGGEGVAWHDTTPGNVFNAFRSDDMDVGPIPGGGHHVGFLGTGEWAEYTLSVPRSGSYILDLRVASDYTGANNYRILVDGVNVSGTRTVGYTGGWHNYVTQSVPVTLSAGTRVMRVAFDVGHWNLDWIDVRGQTPYGGFATQLPGRLEAERYDLGGEGLAYHDTTPGNVFNTLPLRGHGRGSHPRRWLPSRLHQERRVGRVHGQHQPGRIARAALSLRDDPGQLPVPRSDRRTGRERGADHRLDRRLAQLPDEGRAGHPRSGHEPGSTPRARFGRVEPRLHRCLLAAPLLHPAARANGIDRRPR